MVSDVPLYHSIDTRTVYKGEIQREHNDEIFQGIVTRQKMFIGG